MEILALSIVALIVMYSLWSAGLDNVATANIEALSNGADVRVLKSELKSIKVANKVVAEVGELENKLTSKDALRKLRKESKEARNV